MPVFSPISFVIKIPVYGVAVNIVLSKANPFPAIFHLCNTTMLKFYSSKIHVNSNFTFIDISYL